MEFMQLNREPSVALDIAHKLQENGANIATIARALGNAGFPENIQKTVETVLKSEAGQDFRRPTEYQQRQSYPSD